MQNIYLMDMAGLVYGLWHTVPSLSQTLNTNKGTVLVVDRMFANGNWYITTDKFCTPF